MFTCTNVQVVWFKRDIRVSDHQPLFEAAQRGPVLPIYIVEPSVVSADDFGTRHWNFISKSLEELRASLYSLGQPLIVRTGEAVEVFDELSQQLEIATIWAHEETGNDITFQRDRAVREWARRSEVAFQECAQNGVVRVLQNRDGWSKQWKKRMAASIFPKPEAITPIPDLEIGDIPSAELLGLFSMEGEVQLPGEVAAQDTLHSFLYDRGQPYHKALSSPVSAYEHCSRLSPHIAWGTISLKSVVQQLNQRQEELREESGSEANEWRKSLRAFGSRLHWQSHFIQKLESDPNIEFQSFIPTFDQLRVNEFSNEYYEAWSLGLTGFPMVDACVRALRATGYLNFRMRAMLVSFASYDLGLDWRRFGHFLARQWTDYEPGIHYSQLQMQSGTTGINTLRIYNPTKQGKDHDPQGVFIKQWVPELQDIPIKYIHEPNKMSNDVQGAAGCIIGKDYPFPIVDHHEASKKARSRIYELRRLPEVCRQAEEVMAKHGSRKKPSSRQRKTDKITKGST